MASRKERRARGDEPPVGRIAHTCPGRTRLSFVAHKGDTATLTALCDAVLGLPGVHRVEGRPTTGSLIVSHEGPAARLVEAAIAARVFRTPEPPAADETGAGVSEDDWQATVSAALRELSGPVGVARGGAALAFVAMALVQASRGNILPPAATALWYAASLLLGREAPDAGGGDAGAST
ncbi:MAG: hypothetical protein SFW09_05995 [Hyphomicrobiaceae bacterium]|nr:hypothetical protein [Hyphomicrobiaceae bacterium]